MHPQLPHPANPIGSLDFKRLGRALSRYSLRIIGSLLMGATLVLHRTWPVDLRVFAGVAAMSLAAGLFVRFHLRHSDIERLQAPVVERAIWATAMLAIMGAQAGHLALDAPTMAKAGILVTAPLVAQAMLVSGLFGPSIGLVALTVSCLLMGFGGALTANMTATAWVAGAVGAHVVNPMKQRGDLLRAVGIQMAAMALLAVCLTAVTTDSVRTVLESAVWAALAGMMAVSIFWLGIAVMERFIGVVSDWSLLELCSPEHPLLKELCLRAPGTHVHSLGVANLAEGAARTIGANPVLCRAIASFHDIGKLSRPGFFTENQGAENPHDLLSPTVSAQIIVAHVKDGVELARAHRLPQVVVDGIEQHHGTSLVSFFYSRALEQGVASPEARMSEFFRYDGPKPQSKETAIIHLADQVEAVSRTLRQGEDLGEVVRRIVDSSRSDGQLDESDLTFRELQAIEGSFVASLAALRHDRVSYPIKEESQQDVPHHSSERVGPAHEA